MDENNHEHHHHNHQNCFLCGHPVVKHIITGLLVFFGAFAAFYVVTDWHYKRMLDPVVQLRKMDKMMRKESFDAERMMRKEFKRGGAIEAKTGQIVHIEKLDDLYKIVIDLKPFDNNEKNVEVTTSGDTLTINAAGEQKGHKRDTILRFSQSYSFPEDVDLTKIAKSREGNQYIIMIPID